MPHEFAYMRRVEFAETDMAGVVHFSAYFRYMEEAEHAFYRSLGSSAYRAAPDRVEGMPRVKASCEFLRPLRYPEEVEVRLTVRRMTDKAIGYEVSFLRLEGEERVEVARGGMEVLNVAHAPGSPEWAAARLPAELREGIEVSEERQ